MFMSVLKITPQRNSIYREAGPSGVDQVLGLHPMDRISALWKEEMSLAAFGHFTSSARGRHRTKVPSWKQTAAFSTPSPCWQRDLKLPNLQNCEECISVSVNHLDSGIFFIAVETEKPNNLYFNTNCPGNFDMHMLMRAIMKSNFLIFKISK